MFTGFGRLIGGRIGAGIAGFGMAHIMLGFLDRLRPSMRDDIPEEITDS